MRLTPLELFHHDGSSRDGHIVSGVLLRVSWCDDWHEVVPVTGGYLGGKLKKLINKKTLAVQ